MPFQILIDGIDFCQKVHFRRAKLICLKAKNASCMYGTFFVLTSEIYQFKFLYSLGVSPTFCLNSRVKCC